MTSLALVPEALLRKIFVAVCAGSAMGRYAALSKAFRRVGTQLEGTGVLVSIPRETVATWPATVKDAMAAAATTDISETFWDALIGANSGSHVLNCAALFIQLRDHRDRVRPYDEDYGKKKRAYTPSDLYVMVEDLAIRKYDDDHDVVDEVRRVVELMWTTLPVSTQKALIGGDLRLTGGEMWTRRSLSGPPLWIDFTTAA